MRYREEYEEEDSNEYFMKYITNFLDRGSDIIVGLDYGYLDEKVPNNSGHVVLVDKSLLLKSVLIQKDGFWIIKERVEI